MVTNKSAFHVEQPAPARSWELTPLTAQITCTFGTPTGHKVTAIIVESHDSSHISVHVTNDIAFVKIGFAYFVGDNHQQECEDYLTQHLSSPALEYVCRHFDTLCNPLVDEEVA